MNTIRRDSAPTLAALLETLTRDGTAEGVPHDPLSTALHALRSQSLGAPLDLQAAGVLRNGMLGAIRRELGDHIGDMVVKSLSDRPLTRRSVEQILHSAVNLSTARKTALASAAFEPIPLEPPPPDPAVRIAGSNGKHANGSSPRFAELTAYSAESPPSPPSPQADARLQEIVRPLLEGRHEALLKQCVGLVRSGFPAAADKRSVGEAAAELHDRVRTFLDRQGRWPIQDAAAYENHARPAAIVLAAWDVPVELEDP